MKRIRNISLAAAASLAALVSLAANGIGVDRAMPGVAALAKEAWREARSWDGRPYRAAGDYLNEARALAEAAPGALALVRETPEAPLSSVERSTHLAVSFGRLPERTAWTGFFGMPAYDSLLLPWGEGERRRAELAAFGFEKRGETLAWELWTKVESPKSQVASRRSQVAGRMDDGMPSGEDDE